MANPLWCVGIEQVMDEYERNAFFPNERDHNKYRFFYGKKEAESFATKLSRKNPGCEVFILQPNKSMFTPENPNTNVKEWNDKMELIPQ